MHDRGAADSAGKPPAAFRTRIETRIGRDRIEHRALGRASATMPQPAARPAKPPHPTRYNAGCSARSAITS